MIDESLLRDLLAFMDQVEHDLAGAHHELMKAQGADPAKFTWPEWSPQANTLRWIPTLRARLVATEEDAPPAHRCEDCEFSSIHVGGADDHQRRTGHVVRFAAEPVSELRRHSAKTQEGR